MSLVPVGFSSRRQPSYQIEKSLRFRAAASTYLTKTPLSAGTSRRVFTWSGWVKRGSIAASSSLFGTSSSGASNGYGVTYLGFLSTGALRFVTSRISDGQTFIWFDSTAVFVDPSAHYHVQIAVDINQAVATDGCKIWVNNVLLSGTFNSYLTANDMFTNHTVPQYIGRVGSVTPSEYADEHLSEVNMIDGQALDPSHFGVLNENGIWTPKKFEGTYGNNGYYLPFAHGTTLAELGFDCKPNSFREVSHGGIAGASISTADFPFGTSSLLFDGAYGTYALYNADARQNLGSGVFCVKFWVKDLGKVAPGILSTLSTYISQGDNASSGFWHFSTDNITGQISWGFTGGSVLVSASYPVLKNVWTEIVVTRDAANLEKIFVAGRLVNVRSNTLNYSPVSGYYIHLGSWYDTNYPGVYGVDARAQNLNGYLKDVAITTGYIPDQYQTAETVVGTQVWAPVTSPMLTDAKLNKGWAYTGFYVPAEGTNGSTSVPTVWQTHFTPVNTSLTGVLYDWGTDTPADNAPTINPLLVVGVASSVSDANLRITEASGSATWKTRLSTMAFPTTGKWYCEVAITYSGSTPYTSSGGTVIGLHTGNLAATYSGQTADTYGYYSNGQKYNNAIGSAYGTAFTNAITISVAYDADAGLLWFANDGVWQASGDPVAGTNAAFSSVFGTFFLGLGVYWTSPNGNLALYPNFGTHRPFVYTPPTGFLPLRNSNLPSPPVPNGNKHVSTHTRVGTGGDTTITGIPFSPDLVWTKSRSVGGSANYHHLVDRVRGINVGGSSFLNTASTAAETSNPGFGVSALTADGFSLLSNGSLTNASPTTYVDWLFKGGGAPVTNTDGSIASQVSANPLAGISIVTYTGNGSSGTIGHGLGRAPSLIIVKNRTSVLDWIVYSSVIGAGSYMLFNTTAASAVSASPWSNTAPTSSVFTVGGSVNSNQNGAALVAYCFSEIPGFSKTGSYTGNGSTEGPFVYCGFQPAFVLMKRINSTGDWVMQDNKRNTLNRRLGTLYPNLNVAEEFFTSPAGIDFTATGFKIRSTAANLNTNTGTHLFLAFAKVPFKNANAA